ncbi:MULTISPECIES: hypothetical protein [unclassified Clostridium]|uniref:hypothetical protein n=1 Tax=unclassified Clostridium TaxID=2614128 RepID=UPI0025C082AC|nr:MULTISPECIES: hypothetical protein [unclassified Clostridium]
MGEKMVYLLVGFITFFIVEFLATNVGSALGAGVHEAGIIVTAISILCAIIVVCTFIIVDEIKKHANTK